MTVTLLAAIPEGAVERELFAGNPAKRNDRRVREHGPRRGYLDTADQTAALLEAGELDRMARKDRRHVERRALVARLTFAELRIGEACALRWRDVDLAGGWLHVRDAKTDAGRRRVKIRGALHDELLAVRLRRQAGPDEHVFATPSRRAPSQDNIRNRVLTPAVKLATRRLVERGLTPLPDRITPHSLRRTFASLLYVLGEDPGIVMDESGTPTPHSRCASIGRRCAATRGRRRAWAPSWTASKRQLLAVGRRNGSRRRRRRCPRTYKNPA